MTTTVSHHDRTVPLLAGAAVASLVAFTALAGVALERHAGATSPSAPGPPVVSYPGSSVFDNQPAGPRWTRRDDFKRPGRTVLSHTDQIPRTAPGE